MDFGVANERVGKLERLKRLGAGQQGQVACLFHRLLPFVIGGLCVKVVDIHMVSGTIRYGHCGRV